MFSFNSLSSKAENVLSMFDQIPCGGSKVILTEFYKTETGKSGEGIDVNHNQKSQWFWSSIYSTTYSNLGMKDVAKWQFIRSTHPPFDCQVEIDSNATLSWPLPSDICSNFFDIFDSSANL